MILDPLSELLHSSTCLQVVSRVSKYTEKVRVLYIIRIILYFVLIQIIYAAVLCNELRCTFYEKYDLLSVTWLHLLHECQRLRVWLRQGKDGSSCRHLVLTPPVSTIGYSPPLPPSLIRRSPLPPSVGTRKGTYVRLLRHIVFNTM